jgi:hypothetical protein
MSPRSAQCRFRLRFCGREVVWQPGERTLTTLRHPAKQRPFLLPVYCGEKGSSLFPRIAGVLPGRCHGEERSAPPPTFRLGRGESPLSRLPCPGQNFRTVLRSFRNACAVCASGSLRHDYIAPRDDIPSFSPGAYPPLKTARALTEPADSTKTTKTENEIILF